MFSKLWKKITNSSVVRGLKSAYHHCNCYSRWESEQQQHFRAILLWIILAGLWLFFVFWLRGTRTMRSIMQRSENQSDSGNRYRCLFYPGQKLVNSIEKIYNLTVGSEITSVNQTLNTMKNMVYASPTGDYAKVALLVTLPVKAVSLPHSDRY